MNGLLEKWYMYSMLYSTRKYPIMIQVPVFFILLYVYSKFNIVIIFKFSVK